MEVRQIGNTERTARSGRLAQPGPGGVPPVTPAPVPLREAAPAPGDAAAIDLGSGEDFGGSDYTSTGSASTSGLTGTTLGSILDEGEEVSSLSAGGGLGRFPISPQVGRDSIRRGESQASARERLQAGVAGEFLCVAAGVMGLLLVMYMVQYAARYGYNVPPEPIDFPEGF